MPILTTVVPIERELYHENGGEIVFLKRLFVLLIFLFIAISLFGETIFVSPYEDYVEDDRTASLEFSKFLTDSLMGVLFEEGNIVFSKETAVSEINRVQDVQHAYDTGAGIVIQVQLIYDYNANAETMFPVSAEYIVIDVDEHHAVIEDSFVFTLEEPGLNEETAQSAGIAIGRSISERL
ncbi:MAG: hypothetical protein ACLFR1_11585 [Spirochaetia bacterium]